jgi:hypothetical protein
MATPCPHLSKPLFKFDLSVEVAEKNFILLRHIFGGNLHLAPHAQNGLPLSYGSKFKLALMIESIFKFHPSWQKMKTVLTKGSECPLSTLDDSEQLKDINDMLKFGNHNRANQQQELLLKLVKDDSQGVCTSPPTKQDQKDPRHPPRPSQHPTPEDDQRTWGNHPKKQTHS